MDRRTVLGSAGMIGAWALSSGRAQATDSSNWNGETDVVCVGSGAAASMAAIAAQANGAKVVMFEKMPIAGGTTGKSGGVAWIFNNPMMQEQGIADPKVDALRYAVRYGFPQYYDPASPTLGIDPVKFAALEAFYDNGTKAIDLLQKLGSVQFTNDPDEPFPDYGGYLPENKAKAGRAVRAVGDGGYGVGGRNLITHMHAHLKRVGVPIHLNSQVTRIITDQAGRAVGVEVDKDGEVVRIRAAKGVVFGTGGFSHNVELCREHQPAIFGTCSLPGSTGDFIPMAQEIGARMGTLSHAWRSQVVLGEALDSRGVGSSIDIIPGDSMIVVNKYGRRVFDESNNYNDRVQTHFVYDPNTADYPNLLLFMIFDEQALVRYRGANPLPDGESEQPFLVKGRTLSELSEKIDAQLELWASQTGGVQLSENFTQAVSKSIETFNNFARTGKDLEFRRGEMPFDIPAHKYTVSPTAKPSQGETFPNPTMRPIADQGPYYCIVIAPGTLDTAGGPQIDENAQVLDSRHKPIPGLYAAGNCVSAPTGRAYLGSGGTIGPALTFGYIAGMNVGRT